jgi:predicted amidohydrolase
MSTITAKNFKLALVQLGGLTDDKSKNLEIAAAGVKKAVNEGKADVVVLPVSVRSNVAS